MKDEIELPDLQPRKSTALILFGMGVYFVYLYHVGFGEVVDSMANVNLAIFALGFLLALVSVLFDALAWRKVAEKFDYSVSLGDVFHIYMACIFMNNLIPSGSFSGETTRLYFMDKIASNSRLDKSSATVAATRIITAIPFIIGSVIGLLYVISIANVPSWALATCSSITVVLLGLNAVFIGICFSNTWLEGIIGGLIDQSERLFHLEVDRSLYMGVVKQFHESMSTLMEHKITLLTSTLWAFAAWIAINLVAYVTFKSMGIDVPMGAVFAVYAIMIFLQMLPLVLPGGVGLVDIVMATFFGAVGVPMHDAVAATILSRFIQLWFMTALGGLSTTYLLRRVGNKDGRPESPGLSSQIRQW